MKTDAGCARARLGCVHCVHAACLPAGDESARASEMAEDPKTQYGIAVPTSTVLLVATNYQSKDSKYAEYCCGEIWLTMSCLQGGGCTGQRDGRVRQVHG